MSVVKNLKSALGKNEAFLITSEENMRYLTGFAHSEGRVLVTGNEAVFFVDSRYIEAVTKSVKSCEVMLMTSFHKQLGELVEKLDIKRIFTEAEGISVADFSALCKNVSCEFKAEKTDELLTSLRRKKSEEEKRKILKAQAIAEKGFDHILGFIKEGVSEREIALELDFFMLKTVRNVFRLTPLPSAEKTLLSPTVFRRKRRLRKAISSLLTTVRLLTSIIRI